MFFTMAMCLEEKNQSILEKGLQKIIDRNLLSQCNIIYTNFENDTLQTLKTVLPQVKLRTSWYHYKKVNINELIPVNIL